MSSCDPADTLVPLATSATKKNSNSKRKPGNNFRATALSKKPRRVIKKVPLPRTANTPSAQKYNIDDEKAQLPDEESPDNEQNQLANHNKSRAGPSTDATSETAVARDSQSTTEKKTSFVPREGPSKAAAADLAEEKDDGANANANDDENDNTDADDEEDHDGVMKPKATTTTRKPFAKFSAKSIASKTKNRNKLFTSISPSSRKRLGKKVTTIATGAAVAAAASAKASSRNEKEEKEINNHQEDEKSSSQALVIVRPSENKDATGAASAVADHPTLSGKPRLKQYCTVFKSKPRPGVHPRPAGNVNAAHHADQNADAESSTAMVNHTASGGGPMIQEINGELVLQESSMVVSGRTTEAAAQAALEEYDVVEEEAQLGAVHSTYASFRTKGSSASSVSRWSAAETKLFYEALRQVGQDFGTMEEYFKMTASGEENAQGLFRPRSRRMLKQKFKMESNKNPRLVEAALNPRARKKVDMNVFDVEVDEEALKKARQERDAKFQELATKQLEAQAAKEAAEAKQREADALLEEETNNGELEMEDEVVDETEEIRSTSKTAVQASKPKSSSTVGTRKPFNDTEFFWEEAAAAAAPQSGAAEALDPFLDAGDHEDDGAALLLHDEGNKEPAAALSLLPTRGSNSHNNSHAKRKKTKPNFRTRKKKGK